MNIYSTTYSSPLGTIVIESDGECLTGLRFVSKLDNGETNEESVPIIAEVLKWLDDYFAGKQPRNIPRLNPHGTDFQKKVWTALFTIDYGQTKTYSEIAKIIDCRSAQAVGQAISRNPIALIIP
ncbi:MAG: methylated-DNA--[Schwartzia sp.]|nr:methylated-DNA--[protein]-cysteine S-methyltransferase [Schwartzia sp. (in: firmicutes)]